MGYGTEPPDHNLPGPSLVGEAALQQIQRSPGEASPDRGQRSPAAHGRSGEGSGAAPVSDGKPIAFYSDRGGKYEVWVVAADSTGLQQLTMTGSVLWPAWSPDGSLLSSMTSEASYVIDLSKGETSAVPEVIPEQNEAGARFAAYAWSMGFESQDTVPDGVRAGIVTYSIEKRAFERLTETGERLRWLSDGRRLVYTNETGGPLPGREPLQAIS